MSDDAIIVGVTVAAAADDVYAMFTDPAKLVPGRRVVFTWGWQRYLARLAALAERRDPGVDPATTERP